MNHQASGISAELYQAVIGPRGQDYYLRHFARFDADGKTRATWHWPAYWGTLNWLVFRKMWGWALAYVTALMGVALVIFGIGKLAFNYSDATGLFLFLLFVTGAFVLPGIYANALYYRYCREKIAAVLKLTPDPQRACEVLALQASTGRRGAGLALANMAVLVLVAGFVFLALNPPHPGMRLAQMTALQHAIMGSAQARQALASAGVMRVAAVVPSVPASAGAACPDCTDAALPHARFLLAASGEAGPGQATEKVAEKAAEKAEPASAPASSPKAEAAALAASPAKPAASAAGPATTAPVSSPRFETAQLAAAPAKPAASPTKPAKPAIVAPASAPRAKPVRTGTDAKPKANAQRQWFVQVGAFAQEANADKVRAKVQAAGLPSTAQVSDTQAGQLIRVRAGPFESKAEAERAALRIKALDLPAVLVRQ